MVEKGCRYFDGMCVDFDVCGLLEQADNQDQDFQGWTPESAYNTFKRIYQEAVRVNCGNLQDLQTRILKAGENNGFVVDFF